MGHFEKFTDPAVNSGRPYQAYVPSRVQDIEITGGSRVLAALDAASRVIVQADERIKQSSSLPALESLVKSEAIASSYIEGHEISAAELARESHAGRNASEDARAVLRNIEVTHRAVRTLGDPSRPVTLEDIDRIQADLMENHPRGGNRSPYAGMRTTQAILIAPGAIRSETPSVADASHIPPPAHLVRGAMADLVDYINQPDGNPPLVRAALAHAQFETIHPYPDGNGRTGRALIQAMLRREGVTSAIVLPLSPYLAANSRAYVAGLNSVRFEGESPDPNAIGAWVELFATCVHSAAINAAEASERIAAIASEWAQALQARGVRSGAAAYRAIPELLGSIAITTRELSLRLGVGEDTARNALGHLEAIGAASVALLPDRTQVFVADGVADVIAHSQRDIEVRDTPADSTPLIVGDLALPRPNVSESVRGKARCGARMPRSRTYCNLPLGHKGQHRHL